MFLLEYLINKFHINNFCLTPLSTFYFHLDPMRKHHGSMPWEELTQLFDKQNSCKYIAIRAQIGRLCLDFFKLLNLIKSDHVFYCWGSSRKDLESVFVEVGVGHHHCKLQENVEFQTLFQFYIMKLVAKTEFCMHSRRRSSIFYYKIRICKSFKFCVLKFQNDLSFPWEGPVRKSVHKR